MNKKLIGSIIRIQMDSFEFCYARIIENLDYAFYDYKTSFSDNDIDEICKKDILFTALVNFEALKEKNWEVIGKLPLDERHKITPLYFHPDMTNASIIDFTAKKLKETMQYKTFEKRGVQYGGIHSAKTIEQRLSDYYNNKDYEGVKILLTNLEILSSYNMK